MQLHLQEVLIHVVRAMEASEIKLTTQEILTKFDTGFKDAISAAVKDPEVVAFKSIACYRTGLNISPADLLSDIISSLEDALVALKISGDDKIRLASKAFNDHFVRMVLSVTTKPGASSIDRVDIHLRNNSPISHGPRRPILAALHCDTVAFAAHYSYLSPSNICAPSRELSVHQRGGIPRRDASQRIPRFWRDLSAGVC